MKRIAIVGAGGFAREVLTLLLSIGGYEIIGFVAPNASKASINGYPIIGTDEEINRTKESLNLVIAVGDPHLKKEIRLKYTNPLLSFPTLIHPSVIFGDKSMIIIGDGCIICAGTIITTNVAIEDFVTINLNCTVGHDARISNYCSLMPSVNIAGEVHLGSSVYLGSGSNVINQIKIGENCIIGAGAVVVDDIPSGSTAVGVPAKPIKFHIR